MQTEEGGGMAIFWPVCLEREREPPSRDLIFITDVGMGEYIRIFFFPLFSWIGTKVQKFQKQSLFHDGLRKS